MSDFDTLPKYTKEVIDTFIDELRSNGFSITQIPKVSQIQIQVLFKKYGSISPPKNISIEETKKIINDYGNTVQDHYIGFGIIDINGNLSNEFICIVQKRVVFLLNHP